MILVLLLVVMVVVVVVVAVAVLIAFVLSLWLVNWCDSWMELDMCLLFVRFFWPKGEKSRGSAFCCKSCWRCTINHIAQIYHCCETHPGIVKLLCKVLALCNLSMGLRLIFFFALLFTVSWFRYWFLIKIQVALKNDTLST